MSEWANQLRVNKRTDEADINATRGERTALCSPAESVLGDPRVESILLLLSEAQIRSCDALEDVVVVLGDAEDARGRVRDIPS